MDRQQFYQKLHGLDQQIIDELWHEIDKYLVSDDDIKQVIQKGITRLNAKIEQGNRMLLEMQSDENKNKMIINTMNTDIIQLFVQLNQISNVDLQQEFKVYFKFGEQTQTIDQVGQQIVFTSSADTDRLDIQLIVDDKQIADQYQLHLGSIKDQKINEIQIEIGEIMLRLKLQLITDYQKFYQDYQYELQRQLLALSQELEEYQQDRDSLLNVQTMLDQKDADDDSFKQGIVSGFSTKPTKVTIVLNKMFFIRSMMCLLIFISVLQMLSRNTNLDLCIAFEFLIHDDPLEHRRQFQLVMLFSIMIDFIWISLGMHGIGFMGMFIKVALIYFIY